MDNKRYYWIKLNTQFFDLPAIEFLRDQEHGCEYIVLYQMLCLLTANNGGRLSMLVGEMLIPYQPKKIAAKTGFDIDTVLVAMELYQRLGLLYEDRDGVLALTNLQDMVGSESRWAEKKRLQRGQHPDKVPDLPSFDGDNVPAASQALRDNVPAASPHPGDNVRQEKEIEKEIDIEIDIEIEKDREKEKRTGERAPSHTAHGEMQNVFLTETEYGKLAARFGKRSTEQQIEALSLYLASTGKRLKNHYATLLNWFRRDAQKQIGNASSTPYKFQN